MSSFYIFFTEEGPTKAKVCRILQSHNVVLNPFISAHYSFPIILAGLFPLQVVILFITGRISLCIITLSIASA